MEECKRRKLYTLVVILVLIISWDVVKSQCSEGCIALASYYIPPNATLSYIAGNFSTTVGNITSYNPSIRDPDYIYAGTRINIPFSCGCIRNQFMGRRFSYLSRTDENYELIAEQKFSNLTTVEMMRRYNRYPPDQIPDSARLNVTVNCTCGNSRVSQDYGLFITYPLRPGQSLTSVAKQTELSETLLQDYNPGMNFGRGNGLVFVPGKDQNGIFPKLRSTSTGATPPPSANPPQGGNGTEPPPTRSPSRGMSAGAIVGIIIAVVIAGATAFALCYYFLVYKRIIPPVPDKRQNDNSYLDPMLEGFNVDKSVEFKHEELVVATNDFDNAHIIGKGGFGTVFYGDLGHEKAAIKRMKMEASKEFLAELKVLTRVHHVNLVRLIGYCVKDSLFLVYEFIDNGVEPLPWSTRLQIALDSARGLEYIHEHTVPAYIHRDIKSPNILLDKNLRAKVADFGLAKLIEVGSVASLTRVAGTLGYIAPEYLQGAELSPKVDVYAFGVVLYELITAREAIVKTNESAAESKSLVTLFEATFNQPNQIAALGELVDPTLGDDFPPESVYEVACLARACTHEDPQLRPNIRTIVHQLMTLSSSLEDCV